MLQFEIYIKKMCVKTGFHLVVKYRDLGRIACVFVYVITCQKIVRARFTGRHKASVSARTVY